MERKEYSVAAKGLPAVFLLIWLNFTDGINTFGLNPIYLDAAWVFFVLGITVIIDMGTGVNSQIIVTSTYWKFELISGIVLLLIMLPLTYLLTKQYGITGICHPGFNECV